MADSIFIDLAKNINRFNFYFHGDWNRQEAFFENPKQILIGLKLKPQDDDYITISKEAVFELLKRWVLVSAYL